MCIRDRGGGFRCAPSVLANRDRWPTQWPSTDHGTEYRPGPVAATDIVEVTVDVGDLIVFSSRLPHGTVANRTQRPRVAFYLQMFPAGCAADAAENVADHQAGLAPPWWRWPKARAWDASSGLSASTIWSPEVSR